MNPLVTINILSFNRREDLRITLKKVYEQDYKNIEVIVVDNASSDGAPEMVQTEFPEVKLIKLKKNIGIAGWNEGFRIAKGDYILVLDDDSYPEKETIEKGLNEFIDKNTGIISFNIFNSRIRKSETVDYQPRPFLFVGCGALIKKEVIEKVGFFNDLIFIYLHELDYSARTYNKGFDIKYLPDTYVIHNQSMIARTDSENDPFTSGFRYYHHFISYSVFLFQNFPVKYSFIFYNKWIINRLIIALRFGFIKEFLSALIKISGMLLQIIKNKKNLNRKVLQFYNYGNIPLIDRQYFPDFKSPLKNG